MSSNWVLTTSILSLYGFTKEFRPGVPFLNEYLLNKSSANFTDDILFGHVYPVWTYAYLATLIPVTLLTDLLRYKPIIVSEAVSLALVWAVLLWGRTLEHMQIMETFFGWASAAEVAYYAYIYAAVDAGRYQQVTSYIRASLLAGRFMGYGLGQVLMFFDVTHGLVLLNYISFAAVCTASAISLFIPKVKGKAVFNDEPCLRHLTHLVKTFRKSFSDAQVLKWSAWWAMSTFLFTQVGNYIQVLWSDVAQGAQLYNGLAEALNTLLGALAALMVQFIQVNWPLVGESVLGLMSVVQATCLVILAMTSSLSLSYVLYVTYSVLYQALITIATFNVASRLELSSHGLVFGFNTFVALLLQTLITVIFVDSSGLHLPLRYQFGVYAVIQVLLALLYSSTGIFTLLSSRPLTLTKLKNVDQTPEKNSAEEAEPLKEGLTRNSSEL